MKTLTTTLVCAALTLAAASCTKHHITSDPVRVEPIEVKPIHITIDVNVRVDRELDRFFAFEEQVEEKVEAAP